MDELEKKDAPRQCELLSLLERSSEEEIDFLLAILCFSGQPVLTGHTSHPELRIKAQIQKLCFGSIQTKLLGHEISYLDIVRKVAAKIGVEVKDADEERAIEENILDHLKKRTDSGNLSLPEKRALYVIDKYENLFNTEYARQMKEEREAFNQSLAPRTVDWRYYTGPKRDEPFFLHDMPGEINNTSLMPFPTSLASWRKALMPEYDVLVPVVACIGRMRIIKDAYKNSDNYWRQDHEK